MYITTRSTYSRRLLFVIESLVSEIGTFLLSQVRGTCRFSPTETKTSALGAVNYARDKTLLFYIFYNP